MQSCIRHFFALFLVNCPRFVNMACHILAEGLPLAGNGKFPYIILAKAIIAKLHSVFFGILSRESPSVRQYGKAIFLPRDSRLRETANSRKQTTCSHFFEMLFNAKTTFSCVSGIKWL